MTTLMRSPSQGGNEDIAPNGSRQKGLVLMWINFGPYHLARLSALLDVADVTAIEFASVQTESGWRTHRASLPGVITALSDKPYESQPKGQMCMAVWKKLSKTMPRVVLVPGYSEPAAIAAALWCLAHRVPAVLMSDSTGADRQRQRWREWLKSCMVRILFQYASVAGKRSREYIGHLGIPGVRTYRYYDVVDNEYFAAGTDELRRTQTAARYHLPQNFFLFVGRLIWEKNVRGLIDSYAAYRAAGGDWELVIIGDGPLREELRAAAEKCGQDTSVHFAGFKGWNELLPYLAFAGCLIAPSAKDTWGLVVNEAMASGLPVLVSKNCGCSEDLVAEGENGFVFDPNDHGRLAALMEEMASCGDAVRSRRGMRSREIVSEYSPQAFACEVKRIVDLEAAKA